MFSALSNCPNKISVFISVAISVPIFSIALFWWMGNTSSQNMAAPVVVHATAKHTATVIFLHGLGDTGHGWASLFEMIRQPQVKYILPNANTMPVSLNGGFRMPSWFDIKGLDPNSDEDEEGIKESSNKLQALVAEEERSGISRDRIVIGGFSQGGAVALYSALTSEKPPLAGIIALSTWLPLHKTFPKALKGNTATPILQCHGEVDVVVNMKFGTHTSEILKKFNNRHEFKKYAGMGHSSNDEEIKDVKTFLADILPEL